ncbi:MAG: PilZ domain-containing protein [Pseudomonadota bacterium]
MAEALNIDKAGTRSNAIYTTFLDTRAEIAEALKGLRNQRATLQLTFECENSLHRARILDVLDDAVLLEDLQPRSGLPLMSNGRRFSLSGRADGVYLFSEENACVRVEEDRGVPYFRIPLPTNVLYQQRRRSARYQLPVRTEGRAAVVKLIRSIAADKDHSDTLSGSLLDISAGGCRVSLPGPIHPPLEVGEQLASAAIEIPTLFDLAADATIRHASYNKRTRQVICGLEFTGMHVTDRRRLEQFMQSLSATTSPKG